MNNNNKIAIVSASLGVGGAERFGGLLSLMLDGLGYEVHNIIVMADVDYDYKGILVNLGKLFANEKGIFRAVKKGKYIAGYLYEQDIRIVIDNRSRPILLREIFTKWIYGKRKVYYMVHSSHLDFYFPKSSFWSNYLYKDSDRLICVSKAIEESVHQKYQLKNTVTIYNPIIFPEVNDWGPVKVSGDYVLFFGRLEEEIKNFTLLLTAFSISRIYENGIRLLIVGDGKSRDYIASKAKSLGIMDFIELLPFQKNVMPYVSKARFTVLTSRFEGFPMSVIESLSMGTPVVSVDCESGPREIIQNKINGLLVPNHDEDALAEALNLMVKDANLYQSCKNNAQKSVEHLSLTNIAMQWKQLLAGK